MLEKMNYDPTEALSRIDNDKPLLAMLIGVFIKEIPAYTGKLESAASAQDWVALGDAAHKIVNPYLYRVDEVQAIFERISAPLLAVLASDDSMSQWWKGKYTLAEFRQRLQAVPDHRVVEISDAGHMLHHDQPLALAQALEAFI